MKKVILAYIPVLHQGYRLFFEKYISEVETLYLFGKDLIKEFDHLRKDIRALSPENVKDAIQSWRLFSEVCIVGYELLIIIQSVKPIIIMPNEDECCELAEKYFGDCHVEFDDSVFLRWDKTKSLKSTEVNADKIISFNQFISEIFSVAEKEAKKATNWWRQVGAVIVKDKEIILSAHNRHVPSSRIQYEEGDLRSLFKRGINIELITDFHAEAQLITMAAEQGISLKGTDLYVTTFPCPPCAKIVAYSGIKRCFFNSGYAMLDGERILKSQGVEIILVK